MTFEGVGVIEIMDGLGSVVELLLVEEFETVEVVEEFVAGGTGIRGG